MSLCWLQGKREGSFVPRRIGGKIAMLTALTLDPRLGCIRRWSSSSLSLRSSSWCQPWLSFAVVAVCYRLSVGIQTAGHGADFEFRAGLDREFVQVEDPTGMRHTPASWATPGTTGGNREPKHRTDA